MQLTSVYSENPLQVQYIVHCKYGEKHIPKNAGMEMQKSIGEDKPFWYTYDPSIASKLSAFGDDEIKSQIKLGIDLKETLHKLSYAEELDFDYDIPIPQGINPDTGKPYEYFPFQKVAIYVGHLLKRTLLGDEMGIGKTIEALGIINKDESIVNVLVVTKKKLKCKWVKLMKNWLVRPATIGMDNCCDMVVVNYDQLVRRNEMIPMLDHTGQQLVNKYGKPMFEPKLDESGKEVFLPNPLLDALVARNWDMLILDENHRIKNKLARRTKGVYEIAGFDKTDPTKYNPQKIPYILALTGTPIPNRPVEMLSSLKLLIPKSKLAKKWYYEARYCKSEGKPKGMGACNLDELQTKLRQTCMVRRMKAQVLKQLPPKIHQIIPIDVENGTKALVNKQIQIQLDWQSKSKQLKNDMQLLKEKDHAAFCQAASMLKECQGVYFSEMAKVRKELAIEKMPYIIEHLEDMFQAGIQKILVGAHHHQVVDGIAEALSEWGVVTLDGRNQSEKYQKEVEKKFSDDPNCHLFVGGIEACGEGLDLYAAHHVVLAELTWVKKVIDQFEDRTHRIGQFNQVLVQFPVFDGSLDSKFIETAIEKQAIEDAALNSHTIKVNESEEVAA